MPIRWRTGPTSEGGFRKPNTFLFRYVNPGLPRIAIAASTPIFGPTNTTIPDIVACADVVRELAVMIATVASVTNQPSANTLTPATMRPFGGAAAASSIVMIESRTISSGLDGPGRKTEGGEPIDGQGRGHAGHRRDADCRQARDGGSVWATETEHEHRRGERQAIAAGDTTRCPGRTRKVAGHMERRSECPAGDIADSQERNEQAAAAARYHGGSRGSGAQHRHGQQRDAMGVGDLCPGSSCSTRADRRRGRGDGGNNEH